MHRSRCIFDHWCICIPSLVRVLSVPGALQLESALCIECIRCNCSLCRCASPTTLQLQPHDSRQSCTVMTLVSMV